MTVRNTLLQRRWWLCTELWIVPAEEEPADNNAVEKQATVDNIVAVALDSATEAAQPKGDKVAAVAVDCNTLDCCLRQQQWSSSTMTTEKEEKKDLSPPLLAPSSACCSCGWSDCSSTGNDDD